MGFYLFRASYTQKGLEGVMREGGTARSEVIEALAASTGGRVVCQFWAFGADDYILVAELPDNVTAASLASTVSVTGTVSVTTTVLLTAAEIDEAVSRHPTYRAPGA